MSYPCLCTGRSKEFLRCLPNLRPQEDHGDQVWNGQEAKGNVLNRPDHITFQGSTEDAEAREDILELFSDRAAQCGDHVRRPLFVPVWTTDGILYGQLGTDGLKIYILPLVSTVKIEYDRNDFKLKDKGAYCSDG